MKSVDTTQRQIGTPPPAGERIPDEVAFPVGRIRFRAAELSDAQALLAVLDRTFNHWPGFVPGRFVLKLDFAVTPGKAGTRP